MMGKDCERIFSYINGIKDAASSSAVALSNATAYQIKHKSQHAGIGSGECISKETEVPIGASTFSSPITNAWDSMDPDYNKMKTLEKGLFTDPSNFNNSYGSPWAEMHKLKKAIDDMKDYVSSHPTLYFMGEKVGLLGIINLVHSSSVDFKWALIKYHDYTQRGYDTVFNANKPSITHKKSKNKKSIGNLKQKYDENVNVEEDPEEVF
mgnify:CR=1 FL=1